MSELKDFKCPNCGGRLEFDAKSQKLKCPYCEGTFDPDLASYYQVIYQILHFNRHVDWENYQG